MDKLELTILSNLIHNEDYSRKVIPFIKLDYFDVRSELIICQEIIDFIAEYNKCITQEILSLEIQNREDLTEQEFKDAQEVISKLNKTDINIWMVKNGSAVAYKKYSKKYTINF